MSEPDGKWMRGRTRELFQAARALRREMTAAEAKLWKAIRGNRLPGMRFRRQHAIHGVIPDFYCPAHRLAVEVDGAVHGDPVQAERDEARTALLATHGIRVIRFRNEEVEADLPAVLARIVRAKQESDPDT